MSLSAQEKVRVVRSSTSSASSSSRPASRARTRRSWSSSRCSPSVELEQAVGLRVRHDPPPRCRGGRGRGAGDARRPGFAPVVTLVGKTWKLHLEKVTKVDPGREPGDDRRLRRLSCASRASASSTTPSTSSTATATTRGYALECLRAAAGAGAENVTICDTNGSSLPAQVTEATAAVVADLDVAVGIHTHNDLECGVANSLAAVEEGAILVQGTMNGIGERTGNANLTSILPALAAEAGLRVRDRRADVAAHRASRTSSTSC